MSSRKHDHADAPVDEPQKADAQPAGPTAYQQAMAEIAAEAKKLVDAGMGSHDAHAVALEVWKQTHQG